MKILLAEDTRDLNHAVTTMLSMSGFDVDPAYDGEEALSLIQENGYDGIVLDIMMPKKTGLEVLAAMRSQGIVTPVLLLTAMSGVDDRVTGLDAGADDYLTKPFAMKELLARVRALTRRNAGRTATEDIVRGNLTLHARTQEISAESSIRLSAREFELLHILALNTERELENGTILERLWAGEEEAGADTVWLYISYLKTKLFSIGAHAEITGPPDGPYRLVIEG